MASVVVLVVVIDVTGNIVISGRLPVLDRSYYRSRIDSTCRSYAQKEVVRRGSLVWNSFANSTFCVISAKSQSWQLVVETNRRLGVELLSDGDKGEGVMQLTSAKYVRLEIKAC